VLPAGDDLQRAKDVDLHTEEDYGTGPLGIATDHDDCHSGSASSLHRFRTGAPDPGRHDRDENLSACGEDPPARPGRAPSGVRAPGRGLPLLRVLAPGRGEPAGRPHAGRQPRAGLRFPRRRGVLPDQRLRDRGERVGADHPAVHRGPDRPALPRFLGVCADHHRDDGAAAGHRRRPGVRRALVHRGRRQHDHAGRAGRGPAGRHRLLDTLGGAAVLSALRGPGDLGAELSPGGRLRHRLAGPGRRRAAAAALEPPDRDARLRAVLRDRGGALPDPPVRPGALAVGAGGRRLAAHPAPDHRADPRPEPRVRRAGGAVDHHHRAGGAAADPDRTGPHRPVGRALAGHRGRADLPVLPAAPAHRVQPDAHRARSHRVARLGAALRHRGGAARRRLGGAPAGRAAARAAAQVTGGRPGQG
jgi:hypothetical protein